MRNITLLILLIPLLALQLPQGDYDLASKKLVQVKNTYEALGSYSVEVLHKYYKHDGIAPIEEYSGVYIQAKSYFKSILLGITTIQDEKYRITLDTADKVVVVEKPTSSKHQLSDVDYTELLKTCTKVSYTVLDESSLIKLSFEGMNSPLHAISIEVDKNNLIRQIKFYHKVGTSPEGPYTTILFRNYNFKQPDKDLFTTSTIIKEVGSHIYLTEKYSSYTLLKNIVQP